MPRPSSPPLRQDQATSLWTWGWFSSLALLVLFAFLPGLGFDLKHHWASSGLLAFWGCLLSSRLPRIWILPGHILWFAGLGITTLLALWQSGLSDGFTLAGLFPYSDAAGYFADAQRILAGEAITTFSSRRPLYAAFLAAVLKLTGNNLRWALVVQTLLVSCTIGYAIGVAMKWSRGALSSAAFGVVLWLFFRRFIGTTTTENLGLLLGVLGFLALREALLDRSIRLFLLGMFTTALALNARAGAFFVLPALLIWGGMQFGGRTRRATWQVIAMGTAALLLAFAVNYSVLLLSGGRPGLAFSNFSYTLYGLVHGGDWRLALTQHPELSLLEPGRQATSIFQLALDRIATHPFALIGGTLRAWWDFLPRAYLFADSPPHPWSPGSLPSRLLFLLSLRGLYVVGQSRSTPQFRLLLAYLAGITLSVPFAPPWDSDYMRIFAATIPILAWLASEGIPANRAVEAPAPTSSTSSSFKVLCLTVAGFLLILPLPHLQRRTSESAPPAVIAGSVLRIDPPRAMPDPPNPGLRETWGRILRERNIPPIPMDRIQGNAQRQIAPDQVRSFLEALPPGPMTLALATGHGWPSPPGHDTNLVVIRGREAWTFETRGSRPSLSIPPPLLP